MFGVQKHSQYPINKTPSQKKTSFPSYERERKNWPPTPTGKPTIPDVMFTAEGGDHEPEIGGSFFELRNSNRSGVDTKRHHTP